MPGLDYVSSRSDIELRKTEVFQDSNNLERIFAESIHAGILQNPVRKGLPS
jgi:hypothetical protein